MSLSSLNYCLNVIACYRYIVSGNKKAVSLIDKKTGEIAHSITLGTTLYVYQSITLLLGYHVTIAEDVSCMNCAKGVILAGTAGGKVMILSSDNLIIQDQLESKEVHGYNNAYITVASFYF